MEHAQHDVVTDSERLLDLPAQARYTLISAPGWPEPQALDAADDDLAVELGRQLARERDEASRRPDWPTSHRVERTVGPARLVLRAWVSRR
jgi:hypothetical protein